jgi:hypothetical protein
MPVVILYILHCTRTSANELTFIVACGEQLCMLIAWDKALYFALAQSHLAG